jgi:diketogulonate reductase-like aldo/keto reductase
VIIGARDEKQLRDNLGAVGWSLSKEHVAKLDAASDTIPLLSPLAPGQAARSQTHRELPTNVES